MLLLTNCEVHTAKYSDRSFEVRTEWNEICNIFRKLFGGFSVNYQKNVGDYYLNEYPTILVPYFSQVYLSRHSKI